MAKPRLDPSDGLPAIEAQEWAEEKHAALRRYIDISRAARRKFLSGSGASYFELFCGPGRLFLKNTDIFIDGSPLVAHLEAERTKTAFTTVYLGDEDSESCAAVEKRLRARGAQPRVYNLKSEAAARRIARELQPRALNFGFLDPFNLGDLPLTIFETFSPLPSIDLLVHVSAMDLMRALPAAMGAESAPLDRFAPGWREAVAGLQPSVEARGRVVEHWLERIRGLGFKDARIWNPIRGPTNQLLYWLVLVAKHPLATKFWDEVNKPAQGGLFNGGG